VAGDEEDAVGEPVPEYVLGFIERR